MKKEVAILGVGLTSFGRVTGRGVTDMAREAGEMALKDAGVSYKEIQIGFCSHVNQSVGTGKECFSQLGMTGIPVTNIEMACASHTRAVMIMADLIAAGVYDLGLVVGVEKMPRGMVPMGDRSEMPYYHLLGILPMPAIYAMEAQEHMHRYGSKPEHFAKAGEKAHRNGSLNPRATYQRVYSLEEVMNARMICEPVTQLMCSANADGAAATVISSTEKARKLKASPVRLVGWAGADPQHEPGKPFPLLKDGPVARLTNEVYEMTGIGPEDVDVVQLHDAFSPGEIILLEAMGLCPVGEGGTFVWEGHTEIQGRLPVNTDGGLVSCGHPLGASGGRMLAELYWQLEGKAERRQVPGDPDVAMLHNQGLGGANILMMCK